MDKKFRERKLIKIQREKVYKNYRERKWIKILERESEFKMQRDKLINIKRESR